MSGCSVVLGWMLGGGAGGWGYIVGLLSLTVDGVWGWEMKTVREWRSDLGFMNRGGDRNGGIFNGSQGSKRGSIVGELLGGVGWKGMTKKTQTWCLSHLFCESQDALEMSRPCPRRLAYCQTDGYRSPSQKMSCVHRGKENSMAETFGERRERKGLFST